MHKLLGVYKNKYAQLKNTYDEIEREKDHIKVCREFIFCF